MKDNKNDWPNVLLSSPDENAKRIFEKDWKDHELGAIENWSPSFITILTTAMGSKFPALMLWGSNFSVFFNTGYGAVLGDKQHWALGKSLQEVWPEAWESLYGMLKGVIATGVGSWAEDQIYYLHRNGYPEESYFTFSFARIIDERGGFGGIMCTAIETTQKVMGERRLNALREIGNKAGSKSTMHAVFFETFETLKKLNHDVPFAIIKMVSKDGTTAEVSGFVGIEPPQNSIISSNEAAHATLKKVFETGLPEFVEQLPSDILQVKNNNDLDQVKSAYILPIKFSAGTTVAGFLIIGLSPNLPFDEPYKSFLELLALQISAALSSAKLQAEARERENALTELDKLKTTFFSNVSHEFRTPLTLLLGPLEDALEKSNGPVVNIDKITFGSIYRNALRLLKLVNSLLDFSRMEAGKVVANFEPTNIAKLTKELASQFTEVMEKGDLQLIIKADDIIDPIYIDREMWEKIVLNLLSNAFKFTFKGSVQVTLRELKEEVELIVQDSGIGISKEEMPKLFNRFYRVEGAKSRTFEGSGIGLALVKDMVAAHGGKIFVDSKKGDGSTFRVIIPKGYAHLPVNQLQTQHSTESTRLKAAVFVQEAARWIPDNAKENISNKDRSVILIVEDNTDMREYLKSLLNNDYHILTAANGIEALRLIQADLPNLIISDIMMPEMDGLALLKKLRSSEKTLRIPIILLSARSGNEATVQGLNEGADDYLTKPFSSKELIARVQTQLSMVKLRSDLAMERRAIAARDKFLSIASHEINTPLTPLKIQLDTLARVLEKGDLGTLSAERLKIIVNVFHIQVDKISNLIRNLFDVMLIDNGTMILHKQTININEIIKKVLLEHGAEITRANCGIMLQLENYLAAYCDTDRLKQVVTNLLQNALKYAAGHSIKISSGINNHTVFLVVEDNGPGILQKNLKEIFDRYKSIDSSLHLGGLGLGLYLSKQIIESHGGQITVESSVEKGTKFLIELPSSE